MARKGENIYLRRDGRWEGRYIRGRKQDGKPVFGSVYARQYQEVKRRLVLIKSQLLQNPSPVLIYRTGQAAEWMDFWLEEVARPNIRESTYLAYRRQIGKHLIPAFGSMPLREIDAEKIRQFTGVLKSRVAPNTMLGILRLLNAILKEARIKRLIEANPMEECRMPKFKQRKARVLTRAEQQRLERETVRQGDLEYMVMLYTGIRLGELCALRWNDVDFVNNTLTVDETLQRVQATAGGAKTKIVTGLPKSLSSVRVIPVPYFVIRMLRDYMEETGAAADGYIFRGKSGGHTDPRTLQTRFAKITKRLGIRGAHIHTLRHTFATRWLEHNKRGGYEILGELLGHSSPKVTLQFYAHCTQASKRQSMDRMERIA